MPYRLHKKTLPLLSLVVGLGVVAMFVFVIGNTRDLLFGAPFSVETVRDGATLTEGFLPITGTAKHARNITVNGRPLLIDREGNFADGILLSPGYNVVEVALLDQFGKKKVRQYHLVLDQTGMVAQVENNKPSYQQ